MKIAYLFAAILILTSCATEQKEEKKSFVILSSTAENRGDLEIKLYDTYNNTEVVNISGDGTFLDSISLRAP